MTKFWRERVSKEVDHKYKSTVKSILMGKVNDIPISESFSKTMDKNDNDPLSIIRKMRNEHYQRNDKAPLKIFGR
jgi:hypothetical protein